MDRSRITNALDDVTFTADPQRCRDADVIVVDLARHGGAVAGLREAAPAARIVAYGPHVDDDVLAAASAAGADVVVPRSRFFHDPAGVLRARA